MSVIPPRAADIEPIELPPIGCATVGVGVGKTEAMIQIIAGFCLNPANANKEADSGVMVIYAVPTHKLADELVCRFKTVGLTAGVWRGRMAANPASPGDKMCLKPEDVQKVALLGGSIQQSMCRVKTDIGFVSCEYYSFCPYQQQAGELCDKHVVVVPHSSLFLEMPNIGNRNILVIDEAFWSAGLGGCDVGAIHACKT